jgi:hypothetical protein
MFRGVNGSGAGVAVFLVMALVCGCGGGASTTTVKDGSAQDGIFEMTDDDGSPDVLRETDTGFDLGPEPVATDSAPDKRTDIAQASDGAEAAPMDASPDLSTDSSTVEAGSDQTDSSGEADAHDSALDEKAGETSPDAGADESADMTDVGPANCGAGCPTSVSPGHLKLWLSGDWGVECDANSGRLTSWHNQANSNQVFNVRDGHLGPLCGAAARAWSGKTAPFFDRVDSDAEDSVLPIDLSSLVGSNYTVLVVERRSSGTSPAYLLGSTPPDLTTANSCGSVTNAHRAYRFGYSALDCLFLAGSYSMNQAANSCLDIAAQCVSFVDEESAASLDVEVLSANASHVFYLGTGAGVSTDDTHVIDYLDPDHQYLGRANQLVPFDANSSADARFYGDIAEVVIYDAALSDGDRLAVSGYLMDRWQVTNPPP